MDMWVGGWIYECMDCVSPANNGRVEVIYTDYVLKKKKSKNLFDKVQLLCPRVGELTVDDVDRLATSVLHTGVHASVHLHSLARCQTVQETAAHRLGRSQFGGRERLVWRA